MYGEAGGPTPNATFFLKTRSDYQEGVYRQVRIAPRQLGKKELATVAVVVRLQGRVE
jgi:hypothetical protein